MVVATFVEYTVVPVPVLFFPLDVELTTEYGASVPVVDTEALLVPIAIEELLDADDQVPILNITETLAVGVDEEEGIAVDTAVPDVTVVVTTVPTAVVVTVAFVKGK